MSLAQTGYYTVVLIVILWLGLWKLARGDRRPAAVKIGLGVLALVICILPVSGLPLWRSVFAVWGNPSVPLLSLVVAALIQRWWGVTLLSPVDRRAIWEAGAVAGTVLYFHSVLFGGLDLYFLGWDRRVFVTAILIATIVLIGRGHRTGVVLLLVLVAMAAGVLESTNGWDYLVDPVFWLIGVGVSLKAAIAWLLRPRQSPPSAAARGLAGPEPLEGIR
jgi:hypothetical protein